MTNLILPRHMQSRVQKTAQKEEPSEAGMDKLSEGVVERLPKPAGWRVLIIPYVPPKEMALKNGGTLYLPDEHVDRQAVATVCGYVVSVGEEAYADQKKFPSGPWCKKGDWVLFGRYAGARFMVEDLALRLLNDDEIIAVIKDPSDIKHV